MEYFLKGLEFGIIYLVMMLMMFQVKHLVVDFFLQVPYMWMNKSKFLHPGGWLHAGFHGVTSFFIFWAMHPPIAWINLALFLCFSEWILHFFIDLIKMRIGAHMGWKCNTSPRFWDLLGIDQFLHQTTYLAMALVWGFNLL